MHRDLTLDEDLALPKTALRLAQGGFWFGRVGMVKFQV